MCVWCVCVCVHSTGGLIGEEELQDLQMADGRESVNNYK